MNEIDYDFIVLEDNIMTASYVYPYTFDDGYEEWLHNNYSMYIIIKDRTNSLVYTIQFLDEDEYNMFKMFVLMKRNKNASS